MFVAQSKKFVFYFCVKMINDCGDLFARFDGAAGTHVNAVAAISSSLSVLKSSAPTRWSICATVCAMLMLLNCWSLFVLFDDCQLLGGDAQRCRIDDFMLRERKLLKCLLRRFLVVYVIVVIIVVIVAMCFALGVFLEVELFEESSSSSSLFALELGLT